MDQPPLTPSPTPCVSSKLTNGLVEGVDEIH